MERAVLTKLVEILERKSVKYFLLAISIIGFLVCVLLALPQIQKHIFVIMETIILKRELRDISKWEYQLLYTGITYPAYFMIFWFFLLRKKIKTSLLFLVASFVLYIVIYILVRVSGGYHYILYFPLLLFCFIIFLHIYLNKEYFLIKNKIDKIKKNYLSFIFLNSSCFVFLCGCSLGILFFLYIFGTAILDFTYTDWLMEGGDLTQHYLGWRLFRNSDWYFPLGLIDNIVNPYKISIIYTDSIPLFALIFKILSPVLPENFQYFGLFGFICYALQGGIGALIIKKIGGNTLQSIIGSVFFIFSTVMMYRIYGHTSLTAHFIILLSIYAYLHKNNDIKKDIFSWSSLLVLSVLIHIYFVPMVLIFMFFRLLHEYLENKDINKQIIVVVSAFLILTTAMFSVGAFYFVKSVKGSLGTASANLNTFFNPQSVSPFIKSMPLATEFQYEGFSYLGLGMILFVLIIIIDKILNNNDKLRLIKNELKKQFPFISGILISFFIFSLSPVITLNQQTILNYMIPVLIINPVEQIWSIFRSTGRMTWAIVYIVMIYCISWANKSFSVKKSMLLLSVLLLIQWADLKPWFTGKGNSFKTRIEYQSKLHSPVWAELANDYKHIFYFDDPLIKDGQRVLDYSFSFIYLAANYDMTVNDAYLARTNTNKINENKSIQLNNLLEGESKNYTLYVFMNDNELISMLKEAGLYIYFIDNIFVGLNSNKNYLEGYWFE